MGNLERESKRVSRNALIRSVLLNTVKVTALLTLYTAAPNAVSGFYKLGLLPGSRQKETVKRSYLRLLKNGYLTHEGKYLRLTPKGNRELLQLQSRVRVKKPRRWDRKWRVLIFDIPERRKTLRDRVRLALQDIGFIRLQDSVWVFPYDCEDLVTLLKADFRIGWDMLYLIVDQIENDRWLRGEFGLK